MCMPREPEEIREPEVDLEEVEEEIEMEDSLRMMFIINELLEARGEDKVEVKDWDLLCPHQEEEIFDLFFVSEDITADNAVAALRELLQSASNTDHC